MIRAKGQAAKEQISQVFSDNAITWTVRQYSRVDGSLNSEITIHSIAASKWFTE